MLFSSYVFLFFFLPVLIICYYLVPSKFRNTRNTILLIFSLIFYGWAGPKHLLLLCFSIAINWGGSAIIYLLQDPRYRIWKKISLVAVMLVNVTIFIIFKYTDFLIANINTILGSKFPLTGILLPVGISFFTFQGMSYVIDVFRKPSLYLKNPLKVALYITLFPQLVAGPIVRFSDIAAEISCRRENIEEIAAGLRRFILGLAKKIILADTFGIIADQVFSATSLSSGMAWSGALAYTMQIYLDFSGYSDMAIGLGQLFGFHFVENFNYPYISCSITEFWRRWHISLSTWFRDYVYIPLGGNRCGRYRQIFNMTVVWTLTGIWHGASWNFIVWGVYYLVWLIMEKYVLHQLLHKIPAVVKHISTLLIVVIGWVFFRADNMQHALHYLKSMFALTDVPLDTNYFLAQMTNYAAFWIAGMIAVTPLFKILSTWLNNRFNRSIAFQLIQSIFVLAILGLCILYIIASSYNSFIYFQF